MSTLDLEPIKERLAAATEPLPEEARMDAYYYGFERTDCGPVDAVLSAVAIAGKGSHNTDGWTDRDVYGYYDKRPGLPANPRIDDWTGGSAVELIQLTAKASAEKVKTLSDDLAALVAEVERLRGQIEEAKTLHKPERLYESEENCPHTGKRNSESESHVDDSHIDSSDGYMTICLAMPTKEQICASCREDDGSEVEYPCPTIRALDGEAA